MMSFTISKKLVRSIKSLATRDGIPVSVGVSDHKGFVIISLPDITNDNREMIFNRVYLKAAANNTIWV